VFNKQVNAEIARNKELLSKLKKFKSVRDLKHYN
jgi:uncharacterized protein YwgA